jgi:uncharacterized delta-60 repeat protein
MPNISAFIRSSAACCAAMLGCGMVGATPAIVVDTFFGSDGVAIIQPSAVALTPHGQVLAASGQSGTVLLSRYTKSGALDPTFGAEGQAPLATPGLEPVVAASKIYVDANGRIYVAWLTDKTCTGGVNCGRSWLARYLPSGSVDTSFGANGFTKLSIDQYPLTSQDVRLAFDPDGSIIAAENAFTPGQNHLFPGALQTRVERFSSNGTSLDSWMLACAARATDLQVQGDGAIVVAATSTAGTQSHERCLTRYLRNGQLDTTFAVNGRVDWSAAMNTENQGIAGTLLAGAGKITLATFDQSINPLAIVGKLGRFSASGQLDAAFGVPPGSGVAAANVSAIAAGCGGKIVGAATSQDGIFPFVGLTRYNSNGSLDTTASGTPDGIVSKFVSFVNVVQTVLVRDDGVVIVHVSGDGRPKPQDFLIAYRQSDCQHPKDAAVEPVVEFYNASLDHYFISSAKADIEALDSGRLKGWQRTGYTFGTASSVSNPVCRFYIPPTYGDSHFFSASPAECGEVSAEFPQFVLETQDAFRATVPDALTGACLSPTSAPIYRVWNKRADTNHRYITDKQVRDAMVAKGWVAEGYGPDQVTMCTPQQ